LFLVGWFRPSLPLINLLSSRDHIIILASSTSTSMFAFQLPLSGSLKLFDTTLSVTYETPFNSLSRDHGITLMAEVVEVNIDEILSTPSLGITAPVIGALTGGAGLSTPSLGITAEQCNIFRGHCVLSTPSLGITKGVSIAAAWVRSERLSTPSLGITPHDHDISARWLHFQLPLSGSPSSI
jgi:hypothetical protein